MIGKKKGETASGTSSGRFPVPGGNAAGGPAAGIDIGGTFTDLVRWEEGELRIFKLPSTPAGPHSAFFRGLREGRMEDVRRIVHGSTVAVNALLERKGARTALVTTRGFGDVLLIARQTRPSLYDLMVEKQPPLIPAELTFEVRERVGAGGEVVVPLDEGEAGRVAEKLAREGVEAVAVCFLFSFLRPRHEEIMGEYLRRRGLKCYLSSRVLPEYREYERAVTLAVNAYVAPVVEDYLKRLEEGLGDVRLEIMHSGGGTMSVREAGEIPARTLMSGPAGGVVAARRVAREAGRRRLITLDMGGTSTDVSIVEGDLVLTSEGEAAGFPLRFPMIDIHSIGAGGGSVARLDRGGALKVGPESAGADPGPACYGKSLLPTVTDANVVLGRLREEGFLGGRMRIFPQRSLKVMGELAGSLGWSVREAAWGVLSVVLANMAAAVRVMTVERGRDPSDYVLVAYGGAGPMHCCELAEMLGIEEVLVPPCPGTFSALGLLLADRVKDLSLTLLVNLDRQGMERARRVYRAMEEEVRKDEGLQGALIQPLFDLRYRGQSYELMLGGGDFGWDPGVLAEGFHREHERRYGYRVEEFPVELVNIRLRATLPSGVQPPRSDLSAMRVGAVGRVKVVFGKPGGDMEERDSLLLGRGDLQEGVDVEGPALILEEDSTVVVPPRWKVSVSTGGSLVLKRSG